MQPQPKKFQVFVSSTYLDMKKERQEAVMAILNAGHIPAGMELFAANDKSQWETIRKWIDESDIFMLILGGRYGSIESESQKSYIELEYDYAVQNGKPFFSVVISEKALDDKVRSEGKEVLESVDTKKFTEFRAKVMSKMVKEFNSFAEMKLAIYESLKLFERNEEIVGWVRPIANNDLSPLLEELKRIRGERDSLSKELSKIKVVEPQNKEYESLITLLNDENVDISYIIKSRSLSDVFMSHAKEYFLKKYSYSETSQIHSVITLLDLFVIFWKQLKNGIGDFRDPIEYLLSNNLILLLTCKLVQGKRALDDSIRYYLSDKGNLFIQYVLLKKIADPKSC